MNVIVFASRKGGSGKSTLAAHLAAHVHKATKPILMVDADPQGSLTLWHKLRAPVWSGQITNRADLLMALSQGEGAREYYAEGRAAAEISRLWAAIERSIKAIRGTASASGAMHKQAA